MRNPDPWLRQFAVLCVSAGAEDALTGAPQPACDALQQLLSLESRQQGVDGGRPAGGSAALRRLPGWQAGRPAGIQRCPARPSRLRLHPCGLPTRLTGSAQLLLPANVACTSRAMCRRHALPAVVSLGRLRNYLEYRRLPDWMVPAVTHSLLGVLHIRWAGPGRAAGLLRRSLCAVPGHHVRRACERTAPGGFSHRARRTVYVWGDARHAGGVRATRACRSPHALSTLLTEHQPLAPDPLLPGLPRCGTRPTMPWPWPWTPIPLWPGRSCTPSWQRPKKLS